MLIYMPAVESLGGMQRYNASRYSSSDVRSIRISRGRVSDADTSCQQSLRADQGSRSKAPDSCFHGLQTAVMYNSAACYRQSIHGSYFKIRRFQRVHFFLSFTFCFRHPLHKILHSA